MHKLRHSPRGACLTRRSEPVAPDLDFGLGYATPTLRAEGAQREHCRRGSPHRPPSPRMRLAAWALAQNPPSLFSTTPKRGGLDGHWTGIRHAGAQQRSRPRSQRNFGQTSEMDRAALCELNHGSPDAKSSTANEGRSGSGCCRERPGAADQGNPSGPTRLRHDRKTSKLLRRTSIGASPSLQGHSVEVEAKGAKPKQVRHHARLIETPANCAPSWHARGDRSQGEWAGYPLSTSAHPGHSPDRCVTQPGLPTLR
jgi:hypothetical protein